MTCCQLAQSIARCSGRRAQLVDRQPGTPRAKPRGERQWPRDRSSGSAPRTNGPMCLLARRLVPAWARPRPRLRLHLLLSHGSRKWLVGGANLWPPTSSATLPPIGTKGAHALATSRHTTERNTQRPTFPYTLSRRPIYHPPAEQGHQTAQVLPNSEPTIFLIFPPPNQLGSLGQVLLGPGANLRLVCSQLRNMLARNMLHHCATVLNPSLSLSLSGSTTLIDELSEWPSIGMKNGLWGAHSKHKPDASHSLAGHLRVRLTVIVFSLSSKALQSLLSHSPAARRLILSPKATPPYCSDNKPLSSFLSFELGPFTGWRKRFGRAASLAEARE